MKRAMSDGTINNYFPKPVEDVIMDCVTALNLSTLSKIQANDSAANCNNGPSSIRNIRFSFGHPLELIQVLKEMNEGKTQKYLKFPVVMLFADIAKSPSSVKGLANDVMLNIIIATSTSATYKAADRKIHSFAPILRPIYQALITTISRCGYFWVQTPRQLLGHDIERLYWGSQSAGANTANEYIDAIEIKGLKLTLTKANGANLITSTYMQLAEYFINQSRAVITVGAVTAPNTFSNAFFTNEIVEIVADSQSYVENIDYTQIKDGNGNYTGAIHGININFYVNQVLVAWR